MVPYTGSHMRDKCPGFGTGYATVTGVKKELREMVLRSRNTMVSSAVVFLLVVVMLRFTGGFFEENVVRVVGSIFGGNAESVPLLDFSTIDLAWMNPLTWSMDGITESTNLWFHDMVDSVIPATVAALNAGVLHMAMMSRIELLEAGIRITKFSSSI